MLRGTAKQVYEFGRQAKKEGGGLRLTEPAEKDEISHEVVVRHILCHYSLDLSRLH